MSTRSAHSPHRSGLVFLTKKITTPDLWDRYVIGHGASGFGHLFNWSRVISEAYHHHPVYLAAVQTSHQTAETICGILPLFKFKQ